MSQKSKNWAKEVWKRLKNNLQIERDQFVVHYANDPFEVLVAIILSQNTTDKNSIKAFKELKRRIEIKPEILAKTPIEDIEAAIRSAGLYKFKAKAIKSLAQKVLDGLDLNEILKLPPQKAREILISMEGIGKKTADVFLSIFGKRIMGIDVHALRIALRWELIDKRDYDATQKAFMETFSFVDDLDYLHKLLITLGRKYCRAKNPRCDICPLRDLCPSAQNFLRNKKK